MAGQIVTLKTGFINPNQSKKRIFIFIGVECDQWLRNNRDELELLDVFLFVFTRVKRVLSFRNGEGCSKIKTSDCVLRQTGNVAGFFQNFQTSYLLKKSGK